MSLINLFGRSKTNRSLDRHQRGKAFAHLWSSLSEQTHAALADKLTACGIADEVTMYRTGDVPAGRSVHKSADRAQTAGERELSDFPAALADRAELLTFVTPDGTGMIGTETLQPYRAEPLDAVTRFLVTSPSPTDRERICKAFNLATLGRDRTQNVFISKASHDETPKYPEALAAIGLTTVFIDTTNLFGPAMAHETVPARDVAATRASIESAILRCRAELGQGPSDLVGFDPSDWLPPSVNVADVDIWSSNPYRAYLVIPEGYEESQLTERLLDDDDEIRLTAQTGAVEAVRVLVTRELSETFVRTVKTEHIAWLYRNAPTLDAWLKEVDQECSPTTEPQEEVVRFLTEELNVYDDDIMSRLAEVGADV